MLTGCMAANYCYICRMKDKVFFRNLDGLRFLCFLSVFLFHSFHTDLAALKDTSAYHFVKKDIFGNGNLGVNFFFVLSGFLITYLLILEKRENGQISLGKFWMRRILRIWPLFYVCVAIGFLAFPWIKQLTGQSSEEVANPWYYVTFLNNFDFIRHEADASILGVLWSIAIEEQFYLFWPLILYFIPVRHYWVPFAVIIAGSLVFRACYNNEMIYEYHTLSCIGDMTTGAFAAWLFLQRESFRLWISNVPKWLIATVYAALILVFFFRDELIYSLPFLRVPERLLIAAVMAMVILEQNFARHSLFKMGDFKWVSKMGKITYGLYCLHFIAILITIKLTGHFMFNTHLWQVMIVETLLSLVLSIVIAQLSYRWFEKPFLRLKDRFSYARNE